MEFDKLVNLILEQNLGSRVTTGSDEVRNILKSGKVKSKIHGGGGDTYFVDRPEPKWRYMPPTISKAKYGEKLGYVLRADKDKLQPPAERMHKWLFGHMPDEDAIKSTRDLYASKGYKVLPADSPATDIKTLQRIVRDPKTGDYGFKKERDFSRFMKIYNKLSKAFQEGKINVRPPRINPSAGMAGMTALMQFMNDEVPPDMRNSLMSDGGLGVKGKFEATP